MAASPRSQRRPRRLAARRNLALTALALAVCCGIGALVTLARPLRAAPPPAPIVTAEDDLVPVWVPSRPIARGEQLGAVPFSEVRWPKSKLTNDYVHELSPFKNHFALSPLPQLLPIPNAALSASPLDANAVAEAIPVGMRAITVKVDAESAVEGWARSGNFVDVILVRTSRDPAAGLESIVIAENVRILSAGSSTAPVDSSQTAPKAPNTVTLLVSQEDALKVKTAVNLGRLTFALRGTGDRTPTLATSIDQRALLGAQVPAPQRTQYRGKAKGPDGKRYVLSQDSRWLRSEDQP